jgi:hypothetical protein
MLDKNTIVKVRNRDNGTVGYTIPDLGNLHRSFESGEVKEVTVEELRKLVYLPGRGGEKILKEYLVIEDCPELIQELIGEVEPEYYYTEEDIRTLLTEGTLDQFKDCLDFAPEGTINLVKDLAVELQLNDVSKRQALLEKTGFNVTSAIAIEKESQEEGSEETTQTQQRRAAAITSTKDDTSTRRTSTTITNSKYKVVNK